MGMGYENGPCMDENLEPLMWIVRDGGKDDDGEDLNVEDNPSISNKRKVSQTLKEGRNSNVNSDEIIHDSRVQPSKRLLSGAKVNHAGTGSPRGKEDEEIARLLTTCKKKKKNEKPDDVEIDLMVEHLMAELEVAAEEDAELNRLCKPAVNKLTKLPVLMDALSKKYLQQQYLDHGVLSVLKIWLEPLPDGSLPNMNIRTAILKILGDFAIDLEQQDRREQLKKSGIGKVIMFLSRTNEETAANRKLAKDLVDSWSRSIFNKTASYAGVRHGAVPLDLVVRPQAKVHTDKIRGRLSRRFK